MVCWLAEQSSSPADKTSPDAGPKKTGAAKSCQDKVASIAESNNDPNVGLSSAVKRSNVDGVAEASDRWLLLSDDTDTDCKDSITSQATGSQPLDGESNVSDSDSLGPMEGSLSKDQKCSGVRAATSPLAQVSPKCGKFEQEDGNNSDDASGKNSDDALREKRSL